MVTKPRGQGATVSVLLDEQASALPEGRWVRVWARMELRPKTTGTVRSLAMVRPRSAKGRGGAAAPRFNAAVQGRRGLAPHPAAETQYRILFNLLSMVSCPVSVWHVCHHHKNIVELTFESGP